MKKELILKLNDGIISNVHNHAETVIASGETKEEMLTNFLNNINFKKESAFVSFLKYEKEFVFEVSDDNGSIVGREIFIPKWNEVWEVPGENYDMAIQYVGPHDDWDIEGTEMKDIYFKDENGVETKVKAYIYPLEPNDITIWDILNFANYEI